MNKALNFIADNWQLLGTVVLPLISGFKKKRNEKQNLYLSMKTLREQISGNPRKCFESKTILYKQGLEIWVRNEVGAIDVPPQIEPNCPGWLTKEKKECFRSVIKCIKIHNGFITWAESINPYHDGKYSEELYDSNMAELLKLTAEWEEMKLMEQRSANILFKDQFAGILTETVDRGTLFTYDQRWTETIACCFPITRREYNYAQGLHPFFEHLGAEGWLREQQARITHTSEEDDLGLLLRYGFDCIGAVSIQSPQEIIFPTSVEENTTNPGRTVSGFQKKLLVTKDDKGTFARASASGSAPYIAKFNSERIRDLVRNEALSLRWISAVLGKEEVNEFSLSNIAPFNEMALIVTRFDRTPQGEKLRLEDCAQILSKPKGRDNLGKYNAAYEDIAEIISKHSSRATIDLSRFFRRLIAFALIGNCDAHLKNFSLLETSTGLRLSPAYDVLNTAIYSWHDPNLALSICGRKRAFEEIDQKVLVKFGQEIGLSLKIIDQIFVDLRRNVQKAASIIKPPSAEDPDGFITRFEEVVRNACLRILP